MVKRFIGITRAAVQWCMAGASAMALTQACIVFWRARAWALDEFFIAAASIVGIFLLFSLLVGLVVSVPLTGLDWLAEQRQTEGSRPPLWERTTDFVLGPAGKSNVSTLVVIGAYGASTWLFLSQTRMMFVQWVDFPGVAAIVAAHTTAALAVGVAYRILTRGRPAWQARRWILGTGAAGVAFYLVDSPIGKMLPFSLLPFLVLLLLIFACAARLLRSDLDGDLRYPDWIHRARSGALLVGLGWAAATLFVYPISEANQAATVLPTRLVSPALKALRLGLDFDGDFHSPWLGGRDCDDGNADVNPTAPEVPQNGRDDNCVGGDLQALPAQAGKLEPVTWRDDAAKHPDIIFITVDALRNDYVGKHIKGRSLTPNIDQLESRSIRFQKTYAPSTHTKESFPSIMTGQYPSDWHQLGLYFGLDRTFPEIMGDLGYDTLAITSIPGLRHEIVTGFEEVDNRLAEINRPRTGITSSQTTQLALSQLDSRDRSQPVFLWVHYFDPHAYYVEQDRFTDWLGRGTLRAGYAQEVARTDEAVGALLEGLDKRGYSDNSVIAVFSDHGESIGAHGLSGHMWAAYEEVVRVPFLLHLPGQPPGKRAQAVSLIDLFPTLVDYLKISGVRSRAGESLMPLIRQQGWKPHPIFIEATDEGRPLLRAVVDQNAKLIYDRQRLAYSLFDLSTDPSETRNLVGSRPEQFERLDSLLANWWDRQYNTARLQQKLKHPDRIKPIVPDQVRGEFIGR